MKQLLHLILLLLITLSQASATEMSLDDIIAEVIHQDDGLKTSRIDTAITTTDHQVLEGLLDPTVAASLSGSREKAPVSSIFQATETNTAQLKASITQPLANGDTLSANFNYNRSSQKFPSALAAGFTNFNPAYREQLNLSYRHPLLRGNNRPNYHKAITANDAAIAVTEIQQQVLAHALSLQSINYFYQLASDEINTHIAAQAVVRAKRLLRYQRKREQFGLIEQADRLQAEALLAARQSDLQQAAGRRASDLSLLNRSMHREPDAAIILKIISSPLPLTRSFKKLIATAFSQRPELKLLQAQLTAADAQLEIAREGNQSQIDITAQLGTRALNTAPASAAFQGISPRDHFIALALEYSDQLGRHSSIASIRKAELARQRILTDQLRNREQISDQVAAASTALTSGRPILHLAREQAAAETRKFNAEMRRYQEGRSDTATIVQFEGELRNAALRAELQQLSLQWSAKQLAWAQGEITPTFIKQHSAGR
ncbi:MAG: TolC family protein [Mariprofundus sp.]|nr:TolC family protein [Mariprofundus sp.]